MIYRKDTDGLRALAVLPIVLIHTQLWQLPAGFAGVDIFFVISGFLITGILLREGEAGGIDLPGFYRRRIVRILPALLVMLVLVMIAAQLWLFAPDIRRVGLSAAAAAALVANFGVWLRTGYFEHGARWEPLLHSWSIGVEEQFYLLYPLLLCWIARRAPRQLTIILAVITALSFFAGFAIGAIDANAQYYLLPSRAWELTLGALVAAGATPRIASPRLREGVATVGLGLIVASFSLIPAGAGFPVPWALLPCSGTALLLAYGGETTVARLLALPPLRAIGLISYSLYLWHWPIVVFYRLMFGEIAGRGTAAALALAAIAVAAISYRLVERPARQRWRNAPPRRVIPAG
ncbi:acyltransferase family protein, partial [Sphingomonas sp. CCH9-E2]|uniref:acyltransferase family protein n=2 Tax=unclassified Sphingomonas TaxID=196159 RepID=UPI0012E36030